MSEQQESKTTEEIAAVQARLDELGTGWTVVGREGQGNDTRAYFAASRPASNSITEVIHRDGPTLVQLARETDARLGATKAVPTDSGLLGLAQP